jgi:ATP-binding cassette subfamily B (MDR/TAP) protein 1
LQQLLAKFTQYDVAYKKKLLGKSIISGILFGLSQFFMFMIYAAVFRISAKFIEDGVLAPENMFKSMFALLFGLYGVGQSSQFLSDIEEVKQAAADMLMDMNEPSSIEVDPNDPAVNINPNKGLRTPIQGLIEIKNVNFAYEGRAHRVIRRLNLRIKQGQNTAFVGSSGCGKSTLMQLIMRFYDPNEGQILIDGVDIKDYALDHLRRSFGIVRQEPSLFNGSIDYNIRYNNLALTKEEIWEAANLSNATEFINSTPEGLERNVGNRGEKLSGGQKQRIAIARVVAQKPQIYLFDEATSALDSNSEELVQRAIEQISQMTTSVTIAHRISTIKNCDVIFVMEQGHLIEKGNYDQLLAKNGKFAELARG